MKRHFNVCFSDEICGREFMKYGEIPSAIVLSSFDETVDETVFPQPDRDITQKNERCFMQ